MRSFNPYLIGLVASITITTQESRASLFGEETAVLLEVVSNQLSELGKLTESVGIAAEQRTMLVQINRGVDQLTSQIQSIESVVQRAQGLDPQAIKNLSQVNEALENMKSLSSEVGELALLKLILCDQAVEEAGLQSDTAYKMGQEMVSTGSRLAIESETASPGRAEQITAAASSAQMLATGVQLQTMAQLSQLMAMSLDLQKSQMERDLKLEDSRRSYLRAVLTHQKPTGLKPIHTSGKPTRKKVKL